MLTIYKTTTEGQLSTVETIEHNTLINMVNPTQQEIEQVSKTLDLPSDFFTHILDADERPRIERAENGFLMILNVPAEDKGIQDLKSAPYKTVPVGIIHAKDHLIIVSNESIPAINDVLNGIYGEFATHMKTRISLLLFKSVSESYEDHLGLINIQVKRLQKELKISYKNTELFALINLNKSLVYFSTALSAMSILYRRISVGDTFKIHDEERKRLQAILVDLEQSAEVIEMRRESLSNLMDAYATIIHNNLNTVLKMLTALAIVMIIPTMIGSIFSMNVDLPNITAGLTGEEDWVVTGVVVAVIAILCCVLSFVFYKKKYLRM